MHPLLRNRAAVAVAALVGVAVVAFLAFGVFGIHTAFIDDEVSEASPFASAESASGLSSEDGSSDGEDGATDEAGQADAAGGSEESGEPDEAGQAGEPGAGAEAGGVTTLAEGMFIDRIHSGEGTAVVLTDGTDRFLRFEDDFAIDNGPDLNVYLVADADADGDQGLFDDDYVDLGDLKGNIGSQNYEIPPDVDLDRYDTVVIWCVRFSVAFNAADVV